jgi:hypothetical protein
MAAITPIGGPHSFNYSLVLSTTRLCARMFMGGIHDSSILTLRLVFIGGLAVGGQGRTTLEVLESLAQNWQSQIAKLKIPWSSCSS